MTQLERITGSFIGTGAPCPQFRLETGETISLSGVYERDLPKATAIVLEGRWQLVSTCMQGREFNVTALVPQKINR